MRPSRTTQPFRAIPGREPGPVLSAMTRGRTLHGHNPQDLERATMLLAVARRRKQQTASQRRPAFPPGLLAAAPMLLAGLPDELLRRIAAGSAARSFDV